jgi:hypothetical protein
MFAVIEFGTANMSHGFDSRSSFDPALAAMALDLILDGQPRRLKVALGAR